MLAANKMQNAKIDRVQELSKHEHSFFMACLVQTSFDACKPIFQLRYWYGNPSTHILYLECRCGGLVVS